MNYEASNFYHKALSEEIKKQKKEDGGGASILFDDFGPMSALQI